MIELKNYSTNSQEYGFLKIDEILNSESVQLNKIACLTEDSTLYSSIEFIEKCKEKGIKPIIGLTVHIGHEEKDLGTITLYAKNKEGFKSLCSILNTAKENKDQDKLVDIQDVIANKNNIISIIGGYGSLIYNPIIEKEEGFILDIIDNLKQNFGEDLYLEVLSKDIPKSESYNKIIYNISDNYDLSTLATNNNRYLKKGHYKLFAQKAKSVRKKQSKFNLSNTINEFQYVKSLAQNKLNFYENDISNINLFVKKIEEYSLLNENHYIPTFEKTLREVLREKYHNFIKTKPADKIEVYKERIQRELKIIEDLGFENYFLIFDDIVKNNENLSFSVRGSAIGSLVTHMIGLTHVDPVESGLYFERFLNMGRGLRQELPDMDLETNDVKSVINYLMKKYGENRIITLCKVDKLKAKSQLQLAFDTIRDDILENPNDANGVQRSSPDLEFKKLIDILKRSFGSEKRTLQEELNNNRELRDFIRNDLIANKLIKMGLTYEDQSMSIGRSPASYAITPFDYKNIFSGFKAKDAANLLDSEYNVLEVSKENIERIGLVKLDILANKYLDKLRKTCKKLNIVFDENVKTDSKEVYELLNKGQNKTLNQIKNQSFLCQNVGINNFNDIVNINALLRPGVTKRERESFIDSKEKGFRGTELLKPILGDTYGVIIFDEQIMAIAQEVGGLSLDRSDYLRAALKKDKKDVVAEIKLEFLNGAANKNINKKEAEKVYSEIENMCGKYTFSKAHAIAYSHLIYQQAWLKVHKPAEYFDFFLEDKREKEEYVAELKERGVVLLPLDINRSVNTYKTRPKDGVLYVDYSLSALFPDGEEFSKLIVNERIANNKYEGLYNFVERILPKYAGISVFSNKWNEDPKIKANFKNKVETLIRVGAFDRLLNQTGYSVLENREIMKNSVQNAIDLVLKPYISGDFEYNIPSTFSYKVENYINEEMNFYGGHSFSQVSILKKKENSLKNKP